jgi:hypothetical protein
MLSEVKTQPKHAINHHFSTKSKSSFSMLVEIININLQSHQNLRFHAHNLFKIKLHQRLHFTTKVPPLSLQLYQTHFLYTKHYSILSYTELQP